MPHPIIHHLAQQTALCRQLLVVKAKDWNSPKGLLCLFERFGNDGLWQKQIVDEPIPVMIGKNGLALDPHWQTFFPLAPAQKKEGDGKAPVGLFALTSVFGYEKPQGWALKMPFQQCTEDLFCVDDSRSEHYNRIVSASDITKDWTSAEEMRRPDDLYKWGIVVDYNCEKPQPGLGSCIFMHLWRSPESGTEGCTAMAEKDMLWLLNRLDSKMNPMLLQLPNEWEEALAFM